MRKNKYGSIEARKRRTGMLFTAPWTFGLIVFFVFPILLSIIYSFSNVKIVSGGTQIDFVGLEHYKAIWLEDLSYKKNFSNDFVRLFYTVPIIIALSLVQAIVLNGKFKGRMLARAIFFLPVIISGGVVMTLLKNSAVNCPIFVTEVAEASQTNYGSAIDFTKILADLNLPLSMTQLFEKWFSNLYTLIWSCGVQTILFISGLQTIGDSFYEVSKIEGANKWEEFWYVTFPMLGNITLLVMVYTIVDYFISTDNKVMQQATNQMSVMQIYDRSSAMLWFYLATAGIVIAVALLFYNRFCLRKWN